MSSAKKRTDPKIKSEYGPSTKLMVSPPNGGSDVNMDVGVRRPHLVLSKKSRTNHQTTAMFSLLARRLVSRATVPATPNAKATLSFVSYAATRPVWARTFMTNPCLLEPAAATKKETSVKPLRMPYKSKRYPKRITSQCPHQCWI